MKIKGPRVVAVDFDGTLCENKYPDIGKAKEDVIQRVLAEQKAGAKIILWTCREDEALQAAVDWCKEQGLVFDAINDNCKERKEEFGNNSRKISADVYIDDLSEQPDDRTFEKNLIKEIFPDKSNAEQEEYLKNITILIPYLLSKLTEEQKFCIVRKYKYGDSLRDISKASNMSTNVVSYNISSALDILSYNRLMIRLGLDELLGKMVLDLIKSW